MIKLTFLYSALSKGALGASVHWALSEPLPLQVVLQPSLLVTQTGFTSLEGGVVREISNLPQLNHLVVDKKPLTFSGSS